MLSVIENVITYPIGGGNIPILTNHPVIKNNRQSKNRSPTLRSNIKIGSKVQIVEKQNQGTENYTNGIVKRILTKSKNHPRGIKVQLKTGQVGRVIKLL
jgi:uncharacterized repeat protein (TIGR03833 family)